MEYLYITSIGPYFLHWFYSDSMLRLFQIILIKLFQVSQLIVFIFMLAYFMGTLWYVMTKHSTDKED